MDLLSFARDAAFAATLLRRRPFSCLVQVTNRCNMECSFCDFWPNVAPKKEELTVAEYARLAREMADLGCFVVSIEGGEPLVRKDIVDVVGAFARGHIPVLFTNGWYVTPEIARELFAAGLGQASVSIDYAADARHDAKRGLAGAAERAWRAVDLLRDAAPHGGRQVHVISVLTDDNWQEMEALFARSAAHGVGHQVTLLSTGGFRRGKNEVDRLPPAAASAHLTTLWDRFPHVRFFRSYYETMGSFLRGETSALPRCRAGAQGFNLDHVGNVAPCIEHIDRPVGNVRTASLRELHARLVARAADASGDVAACQDCWTMCRGWQQTMGDGGTRRGWLDLATRMRSS